MEENKKLELAKACLQAKGTTVTDYASQYLVSYLDNLVDNFFLIFMYTDQNCWELGCLERMINDTDGNKHGYDSQEIWTYRDYLVKLLAEKGFTLYFSEDDSGKKVTVDVMEGRMNHHIGNIYQELSKIANITKKANPEFYRDQLSDLCDAIRMLK